MHFLFSSNDLRGFLDDLGEGMVKELEQKATMGRKSLFSSHILKGQAEKI